MRGEGGRGEEKEDREEDEEEGRGEREEGLVSSLGAGPFQQRGGLSSMPLGKSHCPWRPG